MQASFQYRMFSPSQNVLCGIFFLFQVLTTTLICKKLLQIPGINSSIQGSQRTSHIESYLLKGTSMQYTCMWQKVLINVGVKSSYKGFSWYQDVFVGLTFLPECITWPFSLFLVLTTTPYRVTNIVYIVYPLWEPICHSINIVEP